MSSDAGVARPAGLYFERRTALLREMVLDAAGEEVLSKGWEETSIVEVARRSGIHRSRLYGEFGTRERLLRALFVRETQQGLARVSGALQAHAPAPARAIEAAFLAFLDETDRNGPLMVLLRRESPGLAALARAQRPRVVSQLAEAASATWPELSEEHAAGLAEWLLRFGVSVAFVPVTDREQTSANIGRVLGHWVRAHLDGSARRAHTRRPA